MADRPASAPTNALRKLTASLAAAKGRRRSGLFAAEGTKCVLDTLGAFRLRYVAATADWLAAHQLGPEADGANIYECRRADLVEMTSLSLAPDVIAAFEIPQPETFDPASLDGRLTLALDRVQDPGNLGTIIRTADWMGVSRILASADTADCFNPKTVQATMGALARVRLVYGDLPAMLAEARSRGIEVAGTFLDGAAIYTAALPRQAVIVMGNEGSGIGPEAAAHVSSRLLIPSYPPGRPTSESLNVATATAIVLSQFVSRNYGKD